jgi:formiminotetrahydrofolate cyclodeaminase
MTARLTLGKKKYAAVEAQMQAVVETAEALRRELTAAVVQDAQAYEAVMAAFKLPKETPEQVAARHKALSQATRQATRLPLEVMARAVAVMELAVIVVTRGNLNAITDGASGAALARTAVTAAGYNVRTNLRGLETESAEAFLAQALALEGKANQFDEAIREQLRLRGALTHV